MLDRAVYGALVAALGELHVRTDDDLRAIYRYLRTLPPVEHDPGPMVVRQSDGRGAQPLARPGVAAAGSRCAPDAGALASAGR